MLIKRGGIPAVGIPLFGLVRVFPSGCNDAEIRAAFLIGQVHIVQGVDQIGLVEAAIRVAALPCRNLAVGFCRVVGAFQVLKLQVICDAFRSVSGVEGLRLFVSAVVGSLGGQINFANIRIREIRCLQQRVLELCVRNLTLKWGKN